jgi:parallel beta-helix repeat protein
VRDCVARGNGEDGLFLCWRVKHGLFENNTLENNKRFGISIGHKDTDNLLRENRVTGNSQDGIFFRNESAGMAGHRNSLEGNVVENNGAGQPASGIRVRGYTGGLTFKNNVIRDTRPEGQKTQLTGIRLEPDAGEVRLENNTVEAAKPVDDQRKSKTGAPGTGH